MAVKRYSVGWSDRAIADKNKIIDYLQKNWTMKELQSFIKKLDNLIDSISVNPEMFRKARKDSNYRRCVLSKQTTIYYKFEDEKVLIQALWDNRRNPEDLNL